MAATRILALALGLALCAHTASAQSWNKPVVLGSDPDALTNPDEDQGTVHTGPVKNGLRGKIVDKETGAPLEGVKIKVLGASGETRSDEKGRYRLPLAKGKYRLRVYYPLYEGKRVTNVVITGGVVRLNLELEASSDAIEEIVVLAEPEKETEKGVLELRRRSNTMADALSAEEISRSADSNASDAVKRVVSASVVDSRYVYIRGLGDRYVTTLLNGVTLPSPEPDRQAVPLDLFPTSLLANLTIAKSYSATHPGTFGGGTLQIATNTYPKDLTVKFKLSSSANTETTGQAHQRYSGGSLDFLGFDDGTRALPGAVPTTGPLDPQRGLDPLAMDDIGRSFSNNWTLSENRGMPNLGVGVTIGDTKKVLGKDLGYLTTVNYSHKLGVRRVQAAKVANDDTGIMLREPTENVRGTRRAGLGALAAVGYKLSPNNSVDLFSLYTHTGSQLAQSTSGINLSEQLPFEAHRLQFKERTLSFSQLTGKHRHAGSGFELDWQGNVSLTHAEEPDTRDLTYDTLPNGRERLRHESGSGERFYSTLNEHSFGGGVNGTLPIAKWLKTTIGTSAQHTARDFSARQFRYRLIASTPDALFLPPDQIFAPDRIGTDFRLLEETQPTDAYEANRQVLAGYASTQVQATEDWRFTAGLRFEHSAQEVTSGSDFAVGIRMDDETVSRKDNDFLPSVSSVYALTPSMNLRAAYSRTLARPRFRELAEFLYFDYTRRRNISGNPDVLPTRIHNADFRWEWFAGDTDLFAVSAFYKRFQDPIEMIIYQTDNGDVQPDNAASADVMGLEFEARSSLERIHSALSNFRAWGNVSIIDSQVKLREEQVNSQTNAQRPLQGQSPYVINLGLGYSHEKVGLDSNLLYNVFGRRLSEVGILGLPDVYEQPFHRLDFTLGQRLGDELKLKASATNLLGQKVRQEQGGLAIQTYQPGRGVSLSLSWTPY